jgi:trimeric autotransporter adhesin
MKKILLKLDLAKSPSFFLFIAACLFSIDTNAQIITTVAGDGIGFYSGDGGQATDAELRVSCGVAVDKTGNIFIADNGNNRVRRVDAITGIISTIAGTGSPGFNSDGIQATAANIGEPWNVALDSAGNVYIGDWYNDRIRKVTVSSGIISTVAGTGVLGFNGDGIQATAAQLEYAQGMYIDIHGDIYFADVDNQRIRKIDSTGIITTLAGNGGTGYNGDGIMATDAELYNPTTVYLDKVGNFYFPDYYNNEVRMVTVSTGIISCVAGNGVGAFSGDGGPATAAEVYNPTGVALDVNGNIYISDYSNQRIREITASSGIINTVAGNGVAGYYGDGGLATSAEVNGPWDVQVTPTAFYIAEWSGNKIRKVTLPVTTGIEQVSNGLNVSVYPNPATENITVQIDGADGTNQFTLFNTVGQQIKQEYSNEKTTTIPVGNLSPGIYFLKILNQNGEITVRKVCVERQ